MKITASAIEFGTSKIVTLVGEGNGNNPAELLGAGTVPYDGFMDGKWNMPDEAVDDCIRRSITQAESAAHVSIKEIYAGVPGEFLRVELNEVELPLSESGRRITVDDVDQIMQNALDFDIRGGEIIHRSPAWFSVDDKRTMEPVGLRGTKLRCMATFIVADSAFMQDVTARLSAMNIQVKEFFCASLGEALMLIPPDERDRQAVLIDVGYLSTEVMAVEGDALVYHTVLPVGGGHITADLVYGLECSMMVAEQIKRKYVFGRQPSMKMEATDEEGETLTFDRDFVQEIIEARVDELSQMVQEALSQVGLLLSPRNTFYLTGGGLAMMRGGREYLAAILERPVKAPLPLAAKLNSPMYSSSLGLLELVYESIAQSEEAEQAMGPMQKAGAFLKSFFTK